MKFSDSWVIDSCSVMPDSLQPMDCSLSGSSFHGILQARLLEWVAISFSKWSSRKGKNNLRWQNSGHLGKERRNWLGKSQKEISRMTKCSISCFEWWLHRFIQLPKFTALSPTNYCIIHKLYHNNRKKNLRNTVYLLNMIPLQNLYLKGNLKILSFILQNF